MRRRLALRWFRAQRALAAIGLILLLLSPVIGRSDEWRSSDSSNTLEVTDLHVQVVTPDASPLPGASVQLGPATGEQRTLLTDRQGMVVLDDIPCGTTVVLRVEFPAMVILRAEFSPCDAPSNFIRMCLEERGVERVRLVCHGPIIDIEKTSASTSFGSSFLGDLPGAGGHSRPVSRRKKPKGKECSDMIAWAPDR